MGQRFGHFSIEGGHPGRDRGPRDNRRLRNRVFICVLKCPCREPSQSGNVADGSEEHV
jgi:hypothetical protein